jgi:shikimate dehydrogenase
LANRTASKAETLAGEVTSLSPKTEVKLLSWTDEAVAAVLPEIDLIVNATSLGMKAADARLVPAEALLARHLFFDMVYRADGETPLLADAKMAGAKVVDGLTLLLHQGAISFEHWFGGTAPLDAMREGLRNALKA